MPKGPRKFYLSFEKRGLTRFGGLSLGMELRAGNVHPSRGASNFLKFLCLPPEFQHWNLSTLRRELWWLAAEGVRRGHRNLLVLPARYPRQDLFVKIQPATAEVRPLI